MLAWILNTSLLLIEDSSNVLSLHNVSHYFKTLEICDFFKVLSSFKFIKHAIKHLIIKAFDLLNTIPLTRTKRLLATC